MAKTTFICRRCDRVYYEISREIWNTDREKYNKEARKAKHKHLCPWMKSKKK